MLGRLKNCFKKSGENAPLVGTSNTTQSSSWKSWCVEKLKGIPLSLAALVPIAFWRKSFEGDFGGPSLLPSPVGKEAAGVMFAAGAALEIAASARTEARFHEIEKLKEIAERLKQASDIEFRANSASQTTEAEMEHQQLLKKDSRCRKAFDYLLISSNAGLQRTSSWMLLLLVTDFFFIELNPTAQTVGLAMSVLLGLLSASHDMYKLVKPRIELEREINGLISARSFTSSS